MRLPVEEVERLREKVSKLFDRIHELEEEKAELDLMNQLLRKEIKSAREALKYGYVR